MKIALSILLVPLFFLFQGCSSHLHSYTVKGAEEFVMDSYKIGQGKYSILELEGIEVGSLPKDAMEEYVEPIGDGDILNLAIYHPERSEIAEAIAQINSSIGFKVMNGEITLPELTSVHVAGLTLEQARIKIQTLYNKEIKEIEVFISFRDKTLRHVELAGNVSISSLPVDGKLRLYDVLSKAQVPTNANLFKSYIVRDENLLPIDLVKLVKKGDMAQNIVMRAGDKIYIAGASASIVMVMGEVGNPRAIAVPNGSISLREALVEAGGVPYTGNKNYIQVIRGNINQPKVYVLNWNHIVHLPNRSLLLMPGDVVYISAKPITKWNRFLNQLLPSSTALTRSYRTYQLLGGT